MQQLMLRTEKQEGLQIVFVRQNKKHSGVYKCLQVKVSPTHDVDDDINFDEPSRQ